MTRSSILTITLLTIMAAQIRAATIILDTLTDNDISQFAGALQRPVEQFSLFPTFSINAGGANLQSSTPFTVGGRTINLRDIAPRGLVDITSGPLIPLNGSTSTSPIFAVSGYSLVAAR